MLREYAFLGDGYRGALIGPEGDIGWMCAPRWDSPPLFTKLLGGEPFYQIRPTTRFVWGGFYEPASLIWHSHWVLEPRQDHTRAGESGVIECVEALAYPAGPHHAVLLRRICAVTGPAGVVATVVLGPAAHTSTLGHPVTAGWSTHTGQLHVRWTAASDRHIVSSQADNDRWSVTLSLDPGEHCDLVFEASDRPLGPDRPDATALWESTRRAWDRAIPDIKGLCPTDAAQSYAVMRGLTHPDGGTVAAPTTSMPERTNARRNYDYRYVWIRDTSYCGLAAAEVGDADFVARSTAFVAARLLDHGDELAPAYTVTGDDVPTEGALGLPGYPGGGDRIGNHVREQFQLDVFGEALLLLACAARADCLDTDGRRATDTAARAIANLWQRPDAGIWEIEDRRWTHSRLACVAGLHAVADAIGGPHAGRRRELADHILRETQRTASTRDGRWQRADDDPGLDGALLQAGLRGAIPAGDRLSRNTLDAYLRELTLDGCAYRFSHHRRRLGDAEGSFVLCGFWVAQSLHRQQRPTEAVGWFERTRAACGPGRLYSEEFDASQNQLRGNLPQAFVHASMIETSVVLGR